MMRQLILSTAVMLASQVVKAENSLTLPWDEFKTLYTEKIQQQFDQNEKEDVVESIMSIDEAHYKVSVNGAEAFVDVLVRGKHLQGVTKPIRLFDHQVAISQINNVEGGAIISDESGYLFYIDSSENNKSFQVNLTLVVSLSEDRQSQKLAFTIPTAVRNILDVELPLEKELLEYPGIQQSLQRYYFSPDDQLSLRFANINQRDSQVVDVDTFTQIELEGDKYIFTFYGVSDQFSRQDIELIYEKSFRYLDSTLPASRMKLTDKNTLQINTGQTEGAAFLIRFEAAAKDVVHQIKLPHIKNNIGLENGFQIVEPVEAQISLSGKEIKQNIAYGRLPRSLRENTNVSGVYHESERFNLRLKRFGEVKSPETVIEELYFYTSFAENGNEISVIRMNLPETSGDRLYLNPIPNTEIWSLLVNGNKRDVFTRLNDKQESIWMIPLAETGASVVELTYLQKHEKLGLEGKLPIVIPETGIAAQNVFVNIGLSERLELVAVEGELSPAENEQCPIVESFSGKSYLFKYPLYRGKEIEAAIFYKEPLEKG